MRLPQITGVTLIGIALLVGMATARGAPARTSTSPSVSITTYTDPSISDPYWGITTGPDRALWFTNQGNNSIGRITTGGAISNYTAPEIGYPIGMTAGPDGALWFTNSGSNSIGRITTSGAISNYTDPSISTPFGITTGPDGAIWFTNFTGASIGRITTDGVISTFTDPSINYPFAITTGPDGALWFTNEGNGSIGRITTDGNISNYADPSIGSPGGITVGPDAALWFTNAGNNSIGRLGIAGISIDDTTPPVIAVPSDVIVNATSPAGAVVSFTATATDNVDPNPTVACSPASGSMFPIGTTTVFCTATDASGNRSTGSFAVQVKGASEQLADLIAYVDSNQVGPGASLDSKLENALASVNAGKTQVACNQLQAFLNEVKAQTGKKIALDQAAYLTTAANRIRGVLGC